MATRQFKKSQLIEYVHCLASAAFDDRLTQMREEIIGFGPTLYGHMVDKATQKTLEKVHPAFVRRQSSFNVFLRMPERGHSYSARHEMPFTSSRDMRPWPLLDWYTDIERIKDYAFSDAEHNAPKPSEELKKAVTTLYAMIDAYDEVLNERTSFVNKATAIVETVRTESQLRRVWPEIADDFMVTCGVPSTSNALVVQCEELNAIIGNVRVANKEAA